jgi:uncharacterized membrane protein YdbT with pleckstrin-like domain
MKFKWDKFLSPGEILKKDFSISKRFTSAILVIVIILTILIAIMSIFGGLIILLMGLFYWYYLTKSKHYAFTNKRVLLVESFWGENLISMDFNQITDIEINQSYFDQMGGWGTIDIHTAGTNTPQTDIPFIDSPFEIKQTLDEIRGSKK